MRKVMAFLLSFLMLFSVNLSISASGIDETTSKVRINEYEMIKSIAKKSDTELDELGYSKEEINKIKNYEKEYSKHLEKLSKLEEKNLKKMGYSAEKIKKLKN